MTKRNQSRLMKCLSLRESWVIFFILGIVMMNFPFLSIFNKQETVWGLPLLYCYLYVGWGVSIIVIFIFTRVSKSTSPANNHSTREEHL